MGEGVSYELFAWFRAVLSFDDGCQCGANMMPWKNLHSLSGTLPPLGIVGPN